MKKPIDLDRILVLLFGTAGAQILALATVSLLVKYYDPDGVGILALIYSIGNIVAPFFSLRYENSLLIPKSKRLALNVFALSVLNTIILLSISAVFAVFASLYYPGAFVYILYVAGIGALTSLSNTLTAFSARVSLWKTIAFARFGRQLGEFMVVLALGLSGGSASHLPDSIIFGLIVCIVLMFVSIRVHVSISGISNRMMSYAKKKFISFPLADVPASFVSLAVENLPVLALGYFIGTAETGKYAASARIILAPVNLVIQTMGLSFRKSAADEISTTRICRTAFRTYFIYLSLVSIVGATAVMIAFPFLFSYGLIPGDWLGAEIYVVPLVVVLVFKVIVVPLSYVFYLYERVRENFVYQLLLMISAICFVFGSMSIWNNGLAVISGYVMGICMVYAIYLKRSWKLSLNGK